MCKHLIESYNKGNREARFIKELFEYFRANPEELIEVLLNNDRSKFKETEGFYIFANLDYEFATFDEALEFVDHFFGPGSYDCIEGRRLSRFAREAFMTRRSRSVWNSVPDLE
jgi:hypothetical protein